MASLLVTACDRGGEARPSDLAPIYVADFERLQANPPSDLVGRIVKDYLITDAEFAELQQSYRDCVASQVPGSKPKTYADGQYEYVLSDEYIAQFGEGDPAELAASDALAKISDECSLASLNIEYLYLEPKSNPWGYKNWPEALRACLAAAGSDYGAKVSDDELMEQVSAEGFVADGPGVGACVDDPFVELKELGK